MPLNFNGLKNVGTSKAATETANTNRATLSFTAQTTSADGAPVPITIPGFLGANAFLGFEFILDPQSVQSSFTFGSLKAVQVAISQQIAYELSGGATFYYPGRVWLYVEATGQLFMFGPKGMVSDLTNSPTFSVTENLIASTEGNQSTSNRVRLYLERDVNQTGPIAPDSTIVNIVLFNYEVEPVAD